MTGGEIAEGAQHDRCEEQWRALGVLLSLGKTEMLLLEAEPAMLC